MHASDIAPSSIPIYEFLSSSSNQSVIETTLVTNPALLTLYTAWTHNQHLWAFAQKQELSLFTAITNAGIEAVVDPLRKLKKPLPQRKKTPVKTSSQFKRSPSILITSPRPNMPPTKVEIDLTRDATTAPQPAPRHMIKARCFQCGVKGHFQTLCPSYTCGKCGRNALGHSSIYCPLSSIPPDDADYDDNYDDDTWANITGEPYGDW